MTYSVEFDGTCPCNFCTQLDRCETPDYDGQCHCKYHDPYRYGYRCDDHGPEVNK